jgi:hypothetical protein
MKPKVVVSGREDGRRSERADERMSEGFSAEAAREGLGAYLLYLGFLISRMPPPTELARLEAPYYDYLQAPLQPLADNLESSTYETFEQDPVKYKQYQAAVRQALIERHPANGPVPVVMVLGAGRGPLVDAALYAAVEAGRTIRVFALDKNANAVVTLQNRRLNEPTWAAHVTVGVTVACKLMRACSRDLPQLLGSLRALTSFLLQQESAWCNVQGLLLLQEFAEHRHSSAVALLHTFNPDICALMGKEASMVGPLPADCGAVHGAAAATATARAAPHPPVQPPPSTPRCCC